MQLIIRTWFNIYPRRNFRLIFIRTIFAIQILKGITVSIIKISHNPTIQIFSTENL